MVEEQSDGTLCSLLLLDENGCLRHGAGPNLPEDYLRGIDGVSIGPAVGSCGTAAFRKERVGAEDIATDPLWADYRELALSHGLRACWSVPILSTRGEVLGSVAMYHRQPQAPSPADLELMEIAGHLAGIAIERIHTEEALRDSETLLRTIIDTEPECVMLVDRDGALRLMNHAGLRMIEA
ncbi:MAG: GAF domain-containing protein, partial [Actinomycetota bacterium]